MACFAVPASLQRVCSSTRPSNLRKRLLPLASYATSLETKHDNHVLALNVEGQNYLNVQDQVRKSDAGTNRFDSETYVTRFVDPRWKKGVWDLNMFVKNGNMDWDDLVVAEAKRRKFLEVYPESATNEEPVLFRSSIIPWWTWLKRSYLPEAELINGRAAMVGFFTAYIVDALTRLDLVGQTGNFVAKAAVFVTVVGLIFFKKTNDFADEITSYDKQ